MSRSPPDYETMPWNGLSVFFPLFEGLEPVIHTETVLSYKLAAPLPSWSEPVMVKFDWTIFSIYHAHIKTQLYYLVFQRDAGMPVAWYKWSAGPVDNDFNGGEWHGMRFRHEPKIQGNTVTVEL